MGQKQHQLHQRGVNLNSAQGLNWVNSIKAAQRVSLQFEVESMLFVLVIHPFHCSTSVLLKGSWTEHPSALPSHATFTVLIVFGLGVLRRSSLIRVENLHSAADSATLSEICAGLRSSVSHSQMFNEIFQFCILCVFRWKVYDGIRWISSTSEVDQRPLFVCI